MDEFSIGVLSLILVCGIPCAVIWLCIKSPLFAGLFRLAWLSLWGIGTIGATAIVMAASIGKHEYGVAFAQLIAGGFISLPWLAIGVPAIVESIRGYK